MAVKGSKTTTTTKPIGAKPNDDVISRLNHKQVHFCELYLSGVQAHKAYVEAGYKVKSLNVARSAATRLLQNVSVREYLNRAKRQITKTYELNRGVLLETLMKIALGEVEEDRVVTVLVGDGVSEAVVVKQRTSPKDRAKAAEILLRIVAEEETTTNKISSAITKPIVDFTAGVKANASKDGMDIDTLGSKSVADIPDIEDDAK